jgi:hypothetical protein
MRTVQEIYTQYQINAGLQLHQLRVAAVGATIARAQPSPLDERAIILACLFHDMGNILKSDPYSLPELFAPEGPEYWSKVREEFVQKYGSNEHDATLAIVQECGVPDTIITLIQSMGFSKAEKVLSEGSRELMIVEYSDQRVAPFGVVSMYERLEEGTRRYALRGTQFGVRDAVLREKSIAALTAIEENLFKDTGIVPDTITDALIAPLIEDLRKYEVA